MSVGLLLVTNAAGSAACYLILWSIGLRLRDVTFVDAYWPLGMVLLAWNSFFETGPASPRKLVLALVCAMWGLRLGAYLNWRWRRRGPDRRYQTLLDKAEQERGLGFPVASLLLVFALQAVMQFVVSLPVQLGMLQQAPAALGPQAQAGLALALVGLVFETVSDWQLAHFRADPDNRSRVLETGLWRYSRHPNYFGDACVWWGLYLIAAETTTGLWSLPGPILLTLILIGGKGAPAIEGEMRRTRPGYEAYARRTSGFIPLPPKRLAPGST
jgi:steroid 5-alpha reductase family enzyme